MTEEVIVRRKKKKKKLRVGRILFIGLLIIALIFGGAYFAITKFMPKEDEKEIVEEPTEVVPVRLRTTFQDQVNEEYEAARHSFVGDASEIDLVARYFGINMFTMWGVEHDSDYNGQDMIPGEYHGAFDKQVKNNLFFRYPKILETYGAENLPIVTSVAPIDVIYESVEYHGNYLDGYNATLIMTYQDGSIDGTMNTDITKANELFNQWVHAADVVFFWIPNGEGGGEWKVGIMKNVLSNASVGVIRGDAPADEAPTDEEPAE